MALRYRVPHEAASKILSAAKPGEVVIETSLGAASFGVTHSTVIDYRPVQGPLTKEAMGSCGGCYTPVRPGVRTDHARGCPTGQNGTPNYE